VHVHWTHRLSAYLLFLLLLSLPVLVRRWRRGDGAALTWSALGLLIGLGQVGVAAAMALTLYPGTLKAIHLAIGAAVVAVTAVAAWLVSRPPAAS
jgi:heme A synthase